MAIQHIDIPDAELHEPKGAATATDKEVYLADGAGSGEWRKIRESDLDLGTFSENLYGWNYRKDTTYTSGAPLSIASGIKQTFINNGLHSLSNVLRPLGIVYTDTQFTPSSLNASYVMRIAFKARTANPQGIPYSIKVSMEGGAVPLQFAAQDQFIKGGSYVNDLALTFLFFTGALNTNQPIKIYLTPDTSVSVYDLNYLIQRVYYEG